MASERFLNDSNIVLVKIFPESSNSVEISESNKVGYRYLPIFDMAQNGGDLVLSAKDFVKENLADHQNVTSLYNTFKDYLNQQTDLQVSEAP